MHRLRRWFFGDCLAAPCLPAWAVNCTDSNAEDMRFNLQCNIYATYLLHIRYTYEIKLVSDWYLRRVKISDKFFVMKTKQLEQCLCCQKRTKLYARGVCSSCYQKWRRVMKMIPLHRHAEAEQKLISEGKLLAADAGPKPESNPFVRDLAEFLTNDGGTAGGEPRGMESQQPKATMSGRGRGRPKRPEIGSTLHS